MTSKATVHWRRWLRLFRWCLVNLYQVGAADLVRLLIYTFDEIRASSYWVSEFFLHLASLLLDYASISKGSRLSIFRTMIIINGS